MKQPMKIFFPKIDPETGKIDNSIWIEDTKREPEPEPAKVIEQLQAKVKQLQTTVAQLKEPSKDQQIEDLKRQRDELKKKLESYPETSEALKAKYLTQFKAGKITAGQYINHVKNIKK